MPQPLTAADYHKILLDNVNDYYANRKDFDEFTQFARAWWTEIDRMGFSATVSTMLRNSLPATVR